MTEREIEKSTEQIIEDVIHHWSGIGFGKDLWVKKQWHEAELERLRNIIMESTEKQIRKDRKEIDVLRAERNKLKSSIEEFKTWFDLVSREQGISKNNLIDAIKSQMVKVF